VKKIFFIFGALFTFGAYFPSNAEDVSSVVNMAAAVSSLEKTIELYTEGKYSEAMFQAELGIGYAPKMADFPYLKSLCAKLLGEPSAYCEAYLKASLEKNMLWHRYSIEDAYLLAAAIKLNLKKYNESLKFVNSLSFELNEAQLIKASSLYGLERRKEAEDIILQALDRYSFDSRFPKLFLIQEKDKKETAFSRTIANRILENLYVWKDNDPILLPLSVYFEKDDKINRRNLKVYREMHTHFLSSYDPQGLFFAGETILSNINYGVLSDESSIRELFSLKVELKDVATGKKNIINAVYKEHLYTLSKIVGNPDARNLIKSILSNYSGAVLEDENKDGILESVLYYKSGRPEVAHFDNEQRGYPAFTVECNFGIPKTVHIADTPYLLTYDEYPFVSSVKMEDDFFQMRPRSFKWQAFTLERLKLMLFSDVEKHKSFFVLTPNSAVKEITEDALMRVAAYKEQKNDDERIRTFYDRGEIISLERRIEGAVISLVNYKNGVPSIEKNDIDRDGYFEKVQEFDKQGNIKKISLDFNKDGVFEYNEVYEKDGVVQKEWADGGNGRGKILNKVVYSIFSSSKSIVEWTHPLTGKKVKLYYENDEPSYVEMAGKQFSIFRDGSHPIYWFKEVPLFSNSITKLLEEKFNGTTSSPLFSFMVDIKGGSVFVVKSGGHIFAEFLSD